jgi:xanthine dehydrogenase YagS FAD-binding subunit
MKAVQYVTATSVDHAVQLTGTSKGRLLGGGIDLLGELKEYLTATDLLVNIKALPGLHDLAWAADKLTMGANVTVGQLATDPEVKQHFPGLAEAAGEVGSLQIRQVATLGGNLAQHSRCWYYRHRDVSCVKKGGTVCPAREGENKFNAIFTGNTCVSASVSNLAVILTALDAKVVVQRGKKEEIWTMAQVYEKAWKDKTAHHSLEAGDMIVRVEVPMNQGPSAYLQMSEKSAFDWALVSCGAVAKVEAGKIKSARVALGAVAPGPYQMEIVNQFLAGKTLDEAVAEQAAAMLLKDAQPLSQNGYKVPLARALVKRTLLKLNG